jgi:cytidylate kinase
VGSVTIAATYGAGGSVIAPRVAERLGLPLVERAIPVAMAEKMSAPLEAALADDSDSSSAVRRVLTNVIASSGLFVGVAPVRQELGGQPDIARTEAALRHIADAGGAVILGRAGVFVLQGRPDVLHVRLDGAVEARRRIAAGRDGIDLAAATRKQQLTDRARKAYVQNFYPRAGEWEDPRHYDVVLDSTTLSFEACVDIIERAARDLFARSLA